MNQPDNRKKPTRVTFFTLIQSACAAFFGVQSEANRKLVESGKTWRLVAVGVIFILILGGLVYGFIVVFIWCAGQFLLAAFGLSPSGSFLC